MKAVEVNKKIKKEEKMEEKYNEEGLAFDKEFLEANEEPTATYEEVQKIEKLRSQACLKCFKCCKITLMPVDIRSKEEFAFLETKGFEFFVSGMGGTDESTLFTIIHKDCKHLTKLGCKIYDKRPEACKRYDGRDDPVLTKACLWWQIKEDKTNEWKRRMGATKALEDCGKRTIGKDDPAGFFAKGQPTAVRQGQGIGKKARPEGSGKTPGPETQEPA